MKKELMSKIQIYLLLMGRDLKDLGLWLQKNFLPYGKKAFAYLKNSWKSLVVVLPCLVVLYYGLGSIVCEKIDKNLQTSFSKDENNNAVIETMSSLIAREIDEHMYTPNLPFLFPAYILDNMPAYQSGIIASLSGVLHEISLQSADENLKKADAYLSYPSDVWLFSKTKDFKLAPSSTTQYRKAKQALLQVSKDNVIDLKVVLQSIARNLRLTQKELDKALEMTKFRKADDVFYKAQGRLYANYMLLKAVCDKSKISCDGVYMLLEKAILSEPLFVQNSEFGAAFFPNHLLELAYLTLKSENALEKVIENYVY